MFRNLARAWNFIVKATALHHVVFIWSKVFARVNRPGGRLVCLNFCILSLRKLHKGRKIAFFTDKYKKVSKIYRQREGTAKHEIGCSWTTRNLNRYRGITDMRSGKVDCERNDPPMYATLSAFAPDRTISVSEGSTNVPAATDPSSRSITNCGNTNLGGNSFLVMQPRKDTIKSTFTSVSNDNHVSSSVVQPSSISYHIRSEKERPLVQLSRHLIQNFLRINTVTRLTPYITKYVFIKANYETRTTTKKAKLHTITLFIARKSWWWKKRTTSIR